MAAHVIALICLVAAPAVRGATPFTHSWDTVGDMMETHGKFPNQLAPPQADIEFLAEHYPLVTTGTGCGKGVAETIEQSVQAVGARIKAVNPDTKVGMYWRSDFALELSGCSGFASEWLAHPEWRLKDDNGTVISDKGHFMFDYTNPAFQAFFAKVLVNSTAALTPSGIPALDFVYIDGDPGESSTVSFSHSGGIGPERSAKLVAGVYKTFGMIQQQMDAKGLGQKVILNGMDDMWGVQAHVASGAAGAMIDHWTILQFLNRTTGAFNATMMDESFQLATCALLSNVTVEVKGWPGPIVKQKDQYPPQGPAQPKTPADFQKVIGDRFNSELAFFLLVADEYNFWIYSWFWGWDDFVPGAPTSTIPANFFPQAKCKLGEPKGPYQRSGPVGGATTVYTRTFEHAVVTVDLNNRTASNVAFRDCAY